jgi:geranylgeranyl diphosphate synthase, type I
LSARCLADLYLSPQPLAEQDLASVAALVEKAGGRAWARAESERQLSHAAHWLAIAEPPEDTRDTLLAVAAYGTRGFDLTG